MTQYVIHIDDHEVRAYPLSNLDTVEVPGDREEAFIEFIEEEQPTSAQIEEWLNQLVTSATCEGYNVGGRWVDCDRAEPHAESDHGILGDA